MSDKLSKQRRFWKIVLILIVLMVSMIFVNLSIGVISISPKEVLQTFFNAGTEKQELILFDFRLPEIILCLLIGASLAVSGTILQGVTQNELADPGIIGINSGAGLAIVLFIYAFRDILPASHSLAIFIMPFAALFGAMIAAVLIYMLAWKKGVLPTRLVLVGIGINAGFSALLTILQLRMDPQDYRQVTVWLTGDIWNANWTFVLALLPWVFILIPIVLHKARTLNVFHLGDDVAAGLGTPVERERRVLLLLAVSLAGAGVAAGGAIAFIGLVVPHIARKLIGPLHQYIIPLATLIGAGLLLSANLIGKNLLAPTSIPVGIVVSLVSAPYFIYLLVKVK